jgi:hypothetical protein
MGESLGLGGMIGICDLSEEVSEVEEEAAYLVWVTIFLSLSEKVLPLVS